MQRIRTFYFYTLGQMLGELRRIQAGTRIEDAFFPLHQANTEIRALINQSVIPVRISVQLAEALSGAINAVLNHQNEPNYALTFEDLGRIWTNLYNFEIGLNAEMSIADTYSVAQKGGFETHKLTERPEDLFPSSLWEKVPEAMPDVRAAGRCLAYELGTAAGFHLLRANECVVINYMRHMLPEEKEPKGNNRNLGAYIRAMKDNGVGSEKILATLQQIKDLHRNPLMHPKDSLTVEEAIGLFGIVRSAIAAMLNEFPPKSAMEQLLTMGNSSSVES